MKINNTFIKKIIKYSENKEIYYSIKYTKYLLLNICTYLLLFTSCNQKIDSNNLTKPEDNRFTKVVLAENLNQPMQFEILDDGRVIFVEREGSVKVYEPHTQQVKTLANIDVSTGYYDETGKELQPVGEDGMQGVALDPNFRENQWIYLYYSPREGNSGSTLARFDWIGDKLNLESKKILLEVPNQRTSCCHLGGGMVFDSHDNLYLSTGDNTPNATDGFAPLDERKGKSLHDSQRTSGNTNDLRGKILRIHPEIDGTYSIPKDNLFPEGTKNTRPEIYTMGNRNPYRLSIDSKTGWLYWGEVGPHGTRDSLGRGPKSYDEFNQAKEAGNYGWPYFIADNKAYWDYNYATGKGSKQFDPSQPINDSPNNTGLEILPAAEPAFIWYPQTTAEVFPIPGSGSNSALGGPLYRRADYNNPKRPFPPYYEGKWFITDWSRGWIMSVTIDAEGNYKSMERFLPEINLTGPNDMDFGPDGDLYVLEYGRGPYVGNTEAKLSRIEFNGGNREPFVVASTNKVAGSAPLEIHLSSDGTIDYDNDPLSYEWRIIEKINSETVKVIDEPNPILELSNPGVYEAVLTVSDMHSKKKSQPIELIVGNEPPLVKFDINKGNKSFAFPGQAINYDVKVEDKEDGSIDNKKISSSGVSVTFEHIPEGFELNGIIDTLEDFDAKRSIKHIIGENLINKNNCNSCHTINTTTIGPSFLQIANKYEAENNAKDYLTEKIVNGGAGVWGEVAMPPHPAISKNEVEIIINYILNTESDNKNVKLLPVSGNYTIDFNKEDDSNGASYVFRASYTDKGGNGAIPSLSASDIIVLQKPIINVIDANEMENIILNHKIGRSPTITPKNKGAYLKFADIDLTGIKKIIISGPNLLYSLKDSGLIVEIRIDSAKGKIVGQTFENLENQSTESVSVEVDTVSGVYDLYFVFNTNKEKDNFIDTVEIDKVSLSIYE